MSRAGTATSIAAGARMRAARTAKMDEYGMPGNKAHVLRRAAHEIMLEHAAAGTTPTSVRFVYYELVASGHVDKADKRAAVSVSEALTYLRKRGMVPWTDIVDETRTLERHRGADSVREYVVNAIRWATLDPWADTERPILVVESRSLAGVLRETGGMYGVDIASTNGQVGGFLHTDLGPRMRDDYHRVLYLGDWDRAGLDIEENTREVLDEIAGFGWERLALTDEQVETYDLPIIAKRDGRDGKMHDAVETEALSQQVIEELVVERLEELLPEPLAVFEARAAEQRDEILQALPKDIR